jgi:hypothetical protein
MNNQHLIPPEALPKVYFPGAAVKALMPLGECKRIICLERAAKWQVKDSYLWHWRTFYAGVMFKIKK